MRITITAVSRVAGHDGALDRRGAAPARQLGRVQIEASEARRLEHGRRQQQSVGDDDGGVGGVARRTSPYRLAP